MNELIDLFIRDFVSYWYAGLNHSKSVEFENRVRSALCAATMNAVEYSSMVAHSRHDLDLLSLLAYGIANTLIVHLVRVVGFRLICDLPIARISAF
jgi:hypothetical protein